MWKIVPLSTPYCDAERMSCPCLPNSLPSSTYELVGTLSAFHKRHSRPWQSGGNGHCLRRLTSVY